VTLLAYALAMAISYAIFARRRTVRQAAVPVTPPS
jgi:hypothetical protein